MASDIPPSVYLKAAEANVETLFRGERHGFPPEELARAARNHADVPSFRAAVESVWEERGGHDAAAIRRVRALAAVWGEREPYHTIEYQFAIADLLAALDAQPGHASPHCACGLNDAGQRFVDPICRGH